MTLPDHWQDCVPFIAALFRRGCLFIDVNDKTTHTPFRDGTYLYLYELFQDGATMTTKGLPWCTTSPPPDPQSLAMAAAFPPATNALTLDDWRNVVEYWSNNHKDTALLDLPADVATMLGLPPRDPNLFPTPSADTENPSPEEDMTTTGLAPVTLTGDDQKWKRKKHFDGLTCGAAACDKPSLGYVAAKKPTKSKNGQLWFGPSCGCMGVTPMPLAELARQRTGASDLATVLDIEVGDLKKRLKAAKITDRGVSLNGEAAMQPTAMQPTAMQPLAAPPPETQPVQHPQTPQTPQHPQQHALAVIDVDPIVSVDAVTVPATLLAQKLEYARGILVQLGGFNITAQHEMDYSSNFLATVKGMWKEIEEQRVAIVKPMRAKIQEVQDYFKPPLDLLAQVETVLKQKISEGVQRAQAAQQAAYEAAQAALQSGNLQQAAIATQQAVQSDMNLAPGVRVTTKIKWEWDYSQQLPAEFWSWVPDPAKVQAAIDAGHFQIPGVRVWEENAVASVSAR